MKNFIKFDFDPNQCKKELDSARLLTGSGNCPIRIQKQIRQGLHQILRYANSGEKRVSGIQRADAIAMENRQSAC